VTHDFRDYHFNIAVTVAAREYGWEDGPSGGPGCDYFFHQDKELVVNYSKSGQVRYARLNRYPLTESVADTHLHGRLPIPRKMGEYGTEVGSGPAEALVHVLRLLQDHGKRF
jgi:hypothetical protein